MSLLVIDAPVLARADRTAPVAIAAARRMPVALSRRSRSSAEGASDAAGVTVTPRPLLTKRRPVDFGLVTSCLCRLR